MLKRVVLTSSLSAIANSSTDPTHIHTEEDWSIEAHCQGYVKSKLLAEKAAWDFVSNLEEDKKFELSVIIPCACFGPILINEVTSSTQLIELFLSAKMPMLTNMSFPSVDVRDVATAHLSAMTNPRAHGQRYLLFTKNMWMREIADVIRDEFESQGYPIARRVAPKGLLWIAKFFVPSVNWMYQHLDKVTLCNNDKVKNELRISLSDVNRAIIDSCYSLIERGLVARKPGYHGPQQEEGVAS